MSLNAYRVHITTDLAYGIDQEWTSTGNGAY